VDIPKYELQQHEEYRICKIEEKLTTDFLSLHQHRYYEIIFFTESLNSEYKHSIDFKAYSILKNRLFFIADTQVHQWLIDNCIGAFKGYFIVFNPSFVKAEKSLQDLFDFLNGEPFLDLNEQDVEIPRKLIGLIEAHKDATNKAYEKSLIEALLHFFSEKKVKTQKSMSINQKRFMLLRALIEKHYKDEKQVLFYANKMDMSVKRLNEVVQETATFTVSELIHQRVLLQAKRELSLGTKTVYEIADALGYRDPSYFSKFFKKHTNLSPSAFMGR